MRKMDVLAHHHAGDRTALPLTLIYESSPSCALFGLSPFGTSWRCDCSRAFGLPNIVEVGLTPVIDVVVGLTSEGSLAHGLGRVAAEVNPGQAKTLYEVDAFFEEFHGIQELVPSVCTQERGECAAPSSWVPGALGRYCMARLQNSYHPLHHPAPRAHALA